MKDRPPCIVFLVPGFPSDEADAACLPAVQNYVAAYAARHPSRAVHVVAFQYPFRRDRYLWKGATVHALGGCNRRGVRRLPVWARAFRRVLGITRHARVDVLHSFWLGECALVGQELSRLLGVRHVASIAGRDADEGNPYVRFLRLDEAAITAGSAFAAGVFESHTGHRVDAVVPLGLDAAFRSSAGDAAHDRASRDVDLLGVGSLFPVKDFGTFVDLAARLLPNWPDLKAVIVGDGPERPRLERHLADAGLERHVRLAGHVPREEVRQLMRRSRVLLHPSTYEAQGYVLLEALASGLHVVCRDVGYTAGHPAALRCATDAELLVGLRRALSLTVPPPGRIPWVEETVDAFDAVYGQPVARPRDVGDLPVAPTGVSGRGKQSDVSS